MPRRITNFRISSQQQNREEAHIWLNVGYYEGEEFISLPYGIPLDTMKESSIKSQDPHWRALAQAKNDLLARLLAMADELDEGEARNINGLQLQLYRKKPIEDNQVEKVYEMPQISFE